MMHWELVAGRDPQSLETHQLLPCRTVSVPVCMCVCLCLCTCHAGVMQCAHYPGKHRSQPHVTAFLSVIDAVYQLVRSSNIVIDTLQDIHTVRECGHVCIVC